MPRRTVLRSRRRLASCALAAVLAAGLATRAGAARDAAWPQLPSAAWALDSTRVAPVRSLLLERDAGSLLFEEGRIALARELGGHRVALVFAGRGTLAFTPRGTIEKEQLRRFLGVPA